MRTRTWIAQEIDAALPGEKGAEFDVLDTAWTPAPIPNHIRAVISVERLTVEPAPVGVSSHFRETYRVGVIVQGDTATRANEAALDDVLDIVLEALARIDVMSFQLATRSTLYEQFPAYDINVTIHTNHD